MKENELLVIIGIALPSVVLMVIGVWVSIQLWRSKV